VTVGDGGRVVVVVEEVLVVEEVELLEVVVEAELLTAPGPAR
jgi:hypothetical protein